MPIVQSIISEAGCIAAEGEGEERFLDPRSGLSFVFDHLGLVCWIVFASVVFQLKNACFV